MNKLTSFGTLALCCAASLFFCTLSYEIPKVAFTLRLDADLISEHTVAQLDALDTKGLSQETSKTLVKAQDAAVEVQRMAHKEYASLDTWNAKFTSTLNGVNDLVAHLDSSQAQITSAAVGTLASANQTLAATTTAVNTANTALATTNTTIATTNATIADVDKFVNAPELKTTLANVNQMVDTANAVELKATHDYLHPKPMNSVQKVWKIAEPWIMIGAKTAANIY